MDNIKSLSLFPQNLAEISSLTSAEAGTDARVATYFNLIFNKDTCNAHWFEMKQLPNSSSCRAECYQNIYIWPFTLSFITCTVW